MDFEIVKCNNCGSDIANSFVIGHDYASIEHDETSFEFVECSKCGLIYQNPRPTSASIAKYYPESYSPHHKKGYFGKILRDFSYEKKCVLDYLQSGKLLDVGCASGYFLNIMQKSSMLDVTGVELSPIASQKARDDFGVNVFTGDLLSVNFPDEQYDVVTMWNVLEHVYYPVDTICEVWRILKPGGYFVVRVPYPKSVAAKVFGKFWAGLDLPRHLFLFPKNVLIKMAEEAGFSTIKTTFWGFMWPTSIKFWFNGRDKSDRGVKALPVHIIYRVSRIFAIRLLFFPFWEFINKLGLGENITLVFKKRLI